MRKNQLLVMKKLLFVGSVVSSLLFHVNTAQSASLIISEVVDASLPGGLPKFVELTNTTDMSINLSEYSVGVFNNGNTGLTGGSSTPLTGILAPSDSYVISFENGDSPDVGTFFDVYGFDPDFFGFRNLINGNDTIALFDSTETIVDVYGVVGVDGDGEAWEYTDSFAVRNPNVVNSNTSFTIDEWIIGEVGFLETGDEAEEIALILDNTTPGTHNFNTQTVPEPLTILGTGIALLFGVTMKGKNK